MGHQLSLAKLISARTLIRLSPLPLLSHDWRRFQRSTQVPRILRIATYIIGGIVAIFALIDAGFPMRDPGDNLFSTLTFIAAVLLLVAGLGVAGRFAADRQTGLFGLLLMTRTTTTQFFASRALVQTLFVLYFGLVFLPFYGVAFLYGGVALDRWLAILIYFPTAAAFCCACGFIGPIFTSNPAQAELISGFARYVLAGWPVALNYVKAMATGEPLPRWMLSLGPLHGAFQLIAGFTTRLDVMEFLLTIAVTLAMTLLLVAIGSFALEKAWRHEAGYSQGSALLTRLRGKSIATWRDFLRPRLETQPLVWFAAYNRRHVGSAWFQFTVLLLVWFAGFLAWGDDWVFPLSLYAMSALAIVIVYFGMISRITSRAADLRNGELDYLIGAGAMPGAIIRSELEGLYLQFSVLRWTICTVIFACMLGPLFVRTWNPFSLFAHVATAVFLLWASRARPTARLLEIMLMVFAPQQAADNMNKGDSWIIQTAGAQMVMQIVMRLNKSRFFPTGTGGDVLWGVVLLCVIVWRITVSKRRAKRNFECLEACIRERQFQ